MQSSLISGAGSPYEVWHTRRGYRFCSLLSGGDETVQVHELGQQVFPGGEAVGVQDGGVEVGVGVFSGCLSASSTVR